MNSMKINCKEYQVDSQIFKCSEEKHSKYCLKQKELKAKYPSAKEIIWNPEKQNWSINFDYSDKKPAKVKESQETEEKSIDLGDGDE